MESRLGILLIHGACHGPWCWKYLTPLLLERGYDVRAIDLPGRNPTPKWGWGLRLNRQAEAIVAAAAAMDGPIIALAHSMGGLSMSVAAEIQPGLFKRLIYLSAYLPRNGDRLVTFGARDKTSRIGEATRIAALKGFISVRPDVAASIFYNDCSKEHIDWAVANLTDEPLGPAMDRIEIGDRFAAAPRAFIRCTRDRVISLKFQNEMIANMPCKMVATLDASHSPFFSMPQQLADAIEDAI